MKPLDIALDILLLIAVVAAAWRSRRHPEHRPLALLLALWLVTTLLRRSLRLGVFEPRRAALAASGLNPASVPLTGSLRVLRHLYDACTQLWGFGVAAVVAAALLPDRVQLRWVGLAYGLAVVGMALDYPELRYRRLAVALLLLHVVQVAALAAIVVVWLRRRVPSVRPGRMQAIAVLLVAFHVALTLPLVLMTLPAPAPPGGPTPNPFASWYLAQGQFLGLYAMLIAGHRPDSWTPTWWRRRFESSGNGSSSSGSSSSPSGSSSLRSSPSSSSTSAP